MQVSHKLKIGILGCAHIAAKYTIKAFQLIENAHVVSIASRDYAKAQEWALRFGIKAKKSYEALLSDPDIDAVYIPLPIGLHKEWVLKAAAFRKHVICEKSLAESFDAVSEIVKQCRSQNIVLYENFMCDFHPQHEKVLSLINEGSIGKPFVFHGRFGFSLADKNNFRYNKKLGGGSLNDVGAYTVFMARKMLDNEPVSATCNLFYDQERGVDIQGTAALTFPNKTTAFTAFSFNATYQNTYSLWGSGGLVKVGRAYSIPPEMKPIVELITNENLKESIVPIDVPPANHFELIFRDFCDTVLNQKDKANKINGIYSGLISQAKVLEAMRVSSREKRTVELAEI